MLQTHLAPTPQHKMAAVAVVTQEAVQACTAPPSWLANDEPSGRHVSAQHGTHAFSGRVPWARRGESWPGRLRNRPFAAAAAQWSSASPERRLNGGCSLSGDERLWDDERQRCTRPRLCSTKFPTHRVRSDACHVDAKWGWAGKQREQQDGCVVWWWRQGRGQQCSSEGASTGHRVRGCCSGWVPPTWS